MLPTNLDKPRKETTRQALVNLWQSRSDGNSEDPGEEMREGEKEGGREKEKGRSMGWGEDR